MRMLEDAIIIDCRGSLVALMDIAFNAKRNPINNKRLEDVEKDINEVVEHYYDYVTREVKEIYKKTKSIFELIKKENYQEAYDYSMELLEDCPFPSFCY